MVQAHLDVIQPEHFLDPQRVFQLTASKYYMLASVVILYFDYVLTFDLEVKNLWRKRWTIPAILFLINRYYPIFIYTVILVAVHDPSWSGQTCENFKRFPLIAALSSEAVIGIIVMLRLYALHGKSLGVICILAPFYILQLLFGGWASDAVSRASGFPPGTGCIIAVPDQLEYRFAFLWGSAALFDTLVFGMTLYRVLPMRYSGIKMPLTTLFFRDGTLYFAIMFSARLLNFILFVTAPTADLVTLNWTFNNTITIIMINRLVLNLKQELSRASFSLEGSVDTHKTTDLSVFLPASRSLQTDTNSEDDYEDSDSEAECGLRSRGPTRDLLEEGMVT